MRLTVENIVKAISSLPKNNGSKENTKGAPASMQKKDDSGTTVMPVIIYQ